MVALITQVQYIWYAHSDSFVVVGLIIDAFGELRDQQEQVKEDMEVRGDFILTHTYAALNGGSGESGDEMKMGFLPSKKTNTI